MLNQQALKTEEEKDHEKTETAHVKRKDSRCSSAPHKKDIKSEILFAYDPKEKFTKLFYEKTNGDSDDEFARKYDQLKQGNTNLRVSRESFYKKQSIEDGYYYDDVLDDNNPLIKLISSPGEPPIRKGNSNVSSISVDFKISNTSVKHFTKDSLSKQLAAERNDSEDPPFYKANDLTLKKADNNQVGGSSEFFREDINDTELKKTNVNRPTPIDPNDNLSANSNYNLLSSVSSSSDSPDIKTTKKNYIPKDQLLKNANFVSNPFNPKNMGNNQQHQLNLNYLKDYTRSAFDAKPNYDMDNNVRINHRELNNANSYNDFYNNANNYFNYQKTASVQNNYPNALFDRPQTATAQYQYSSNNYNMFNRMSPPHVIQNNYSNMNSMLHGGNQNYLENYSEGGFIMPNDGPFSINYNNMDSHRIDNMRSNMGNMGGMNNMRGIGGMNNMSGMSNMNSMSNMNNMSNNLSTMTNYIQKPAQFNEGSANYNDTNGKRRDQREQQPNNNLNIKQGGQQHQNNKDRMNNNEMKVVQNYTEMSDEDLAKHCYVLAKDQGGCRFLQKKAEESMEFTNKYLFINIEKNIIELMNDSFGNYLIQKIIENLYPENLYKILGIVEPNMLKLGLNPHGTRVIQKIIERLADKSLLNNFNRIFFNNIIPLSKDVNGNHIIIKFCFTIPFPDNNYVYDLLLKNIYEVATDKHGCCVLQKCIEAANDIQKKLLINTLTDMTSQLMMDQYGNYVLQYIISLGNHETNHYIATFFRSEIGHLSKQKFSSNVIEKCFENSGLQTKDMMVKELAKPDIIESLLTDMYGNYVLQKAMASAKDQYLETFIQTIAPILDRLKTVQFGPKLHTKLLNSYSKLNITYQSLNFSQNRSNNGGQNQFKQSSKKNQKQAPSINSTATTNTQGGNFFPKNNKKKGISGNQNNHQNKDNFI